MAKKNQIIHSLMPSFRVKQTPPPKKKITTIIIIIIIIIIYWLTQNIGGCIKFWFPVRPTKSCPQLVCFCVCASLCFAEWWSSCKLELVYIIVDMTHFSSAWHATPYQPGPASKHECFLQHHYWRTKNPLICKKKQKGVELQEKIALFWCSIVAFASPTWRRSYFHGAKGAFTTWC